MLDNAPMTSQTNQIDSPAPPKIDSPAPTAELDEQLLAFGQAFKRAYERAGLSKRAVALAVPLDRSAIGKIERGGRKPQFETVLRLARAAQTTPAALLGEPRAVTSARGRTNGKAELQASVAAAAERLGENLTCLREAVEPTLTQEDLALTAKVDRSSVNGYETGRVAPRLETIFKLARTLEVEPWRLLTGVGLAQAPPRGSKGRSQS